jgi:hypothetical protein
MSTPAGAALPTSPKGEALPSDLQDLIQEFALAVHKRGIYPAAHPMLHGAVDALVRRFHAVLSNRGQVAIGVSRRSLVVAGIATDERNALIAEFAERLYEHELGVITVLPNLQRTTLEQFIEAISVSPVRGGEPLGARGRSQLSRWPDLMLTRVAFERLELMGSEGGDDARTEATARRAAELWLGLARAALGGGSLDGILEDPKRLADSIERQSGRDDYDATVLNLLRQVIGELGDAGIRDSPVRHGVSDLVQSLDDVTISRLLQLGGGTSAAFLDRACESLTAAAVVRLARVATRDAGVPIAGAMLRLLSKLARDADSRHITSRAVDRALRGVIRRMLSGWKLIDPNPEAYTAVLSGISTTSGAPQPDLGRDICEAERILQIGLAAGSAGPSVEAALARLIAGSGVAAAVDCLIACDPSPLRDALVDRLINESTFREELALERPNVAVLQHAVGRLGVNVVGSLLQELERRTDGDALWIVGLLARTGLEGLPIIGERLSTLSSRALRYVIIVFDRCDAWPGNVNPLDYARHSDPTVRRETIRHLFRRDATRGRAILAGLRDRDVRIFNLALGAVSGSCSIEAARAIMSRVDDPELSDELRARCVRAIGDGRHSEVRAWLERRATTRHWLFRSTRLRKPSLELVAIVTTLAATNDGRPESNRILSLARRSKHADLRRSATPRPVAQDNT